MPFQICPLHAIEEVAGKWIGDEVGWQFTCPLQDHTPSGPYTWFSAPEPPPGAGLTGIAAELGLADALPDVLTEFNGRWVEYGVFERAFALAYPEEWHFLIDKYGHTAIAAKRYTVSAFLARALGDLWRAGAVATKGGDATGRWHYNSSISYWALPPAPGWDRRLTWAETGETMDYIPGKAESE